VVPFRFPNAVARAGLIMLKMPYVDGGKIVTLKMGRMYLCLLY